MTFLNQYHTCLAQYVTPEKIVKSKSFLAQLEKAHDMGRLGRIAIDEAHCACRLIASLAFLLFCIVYFFKLIHIVFDVH